MKSTPDEEGRRIVEEDLKRYMPLTAPALARASGTSFRAGEVPVAGRKTLFNFTSLHFTSLHFTSLHFTSLHPFEVWD
jgi:hypothetical protein